MNYLLIIKILSLLVNFRKLALRVLPSKKYPLLGKIYLKLFSILCPTKIQTAGGELFIETGDFFTGPYEPEVTQAFREIIKDTWIVADVGANVGFHTLELSKLAQEVYAFEPCHETYSYLLKNLAHNKIKNVKAVNKALSNSSGFAYLDKSEIFSGSYKIAKQGEQIQTLRMDDLNVRFNLIKIDVEGHELQVLTGMKNILKHKPILIVEFNPTVNNELEELRQFLAQHGYELTNLKKGTTESSITQVNILCR